jgi:hypothetical protein
MAGALELHLEVLGRLRALDLAPSIGQQVFLA